jgi:D-alanine-D-alanine ligase
MLALARDVYGLIGLRDFGRVDFRLDRDDQPFVLEANPNPDITPGSGYCLSLDAAGVPYADFLERLLERALERRHDLDRGRPGDAQSAWPRHVHLQNDTSD